ncbi:unnamed protein product [Auanema sp. JU1783]|nr:unnamed protein product [Auanema sp. JU1783]
MDDFETPANDSAVISDTVAVHVASDDVGGVQLCPALLLGSPQALPSASKHIYSSLAANASEVDEGMPHLIVAMISDGNEMSSKYTSRLQSALTPFVSSCSLWFVSSGMHYDPLARAVTSTIKTVLPQTDNQVEVLHLVVNSDEVIGVSSEYKLVDTTLNTLLIISRKEINSASEKAKFRAQATVRLSHPPPALLIGVPSEHLSQSTSCHSPPILLSPSNDKRPLPISIFAGESSAALEELLVYIENGIPAVILQDSCELCAVLWNASLLYRTPEFEHDRFVSWLREQLISISMDDVEVATSVIVKIFAIGMTDPQLLDFLESGELDRLRSCVVDLCVQSYAGNTDMKQMLLLASRLNQSSALTAMNLSEVLDDEALTLLLCDCVVHDERVGFLAALLELKSPINVNSQMLIKMARATDQHFFHTIVLCRCMGYSSVPDDIDDIFAHDLNILLRRLAFGVKDLFSPHAVNGDSIGKDRETSVKILAVWSLLLHRPAMVRCLCSFSEQPLPFAIVLSRIARSLSHEMLCQPLESFNSQTITQLAFQSNNRVLVAHEACQRWVHRLLYGHLQARTNPLMLPRWAKILFAAFFIVPIRWWISTRPSYNGGNKEDKPSPTVALLNSSRQPKRTRAVSTYSIISTRSEALTQITAPMSVNFPLQHMTTGTTNGAESATPQSMIFPLNVEEPEADINMKYFSKKTRIRKWTAPSMGLFYSTPIVKYWLSLLFRLVHICALAYSVLLPGCGSTTLDTAVWVWSFMWWVESLWVLNVRLQSIDLSLMPWRVFDILTTFVFLALILMLKILGDGVVSWALRIDSVYPARVVSAVFLLYWCYSTLFFYIPLSDIYGPLMVRVKIMILRDFTNFLIMIALIMLTSAASIQAILYPDQQLSLSVIRSSLSWVWLSLFTTDLSSLRESETCRKTFLGAPKEYCTSIGQYGNPTCPSQSWPAYLVIIEYFVILKLILWPILFAFFARTAKAVDEEADKIWKYQMYSLVSDFSVRPPVPPPLTPFFFLFLACCRVRGRLFGFSLSSSDHPDVNYKERSKSTHRFGVVYRNPSVPHKRHEYANSFWRQMAIDEWREKNKKHGSSNDESKTLLKTLQQQMKMISLTNAYNKKTRISKIEVEKVKYADGDIRKINVSYDQRDWTVLLPNYFPPFFCRAVEDFPAELARYVENATEQNVCDLRRSWRTRQVQDQSRAWLFSSAGFPLNPNGRRGIAGRGNHMKFGCNRHSFYIIIVGLNRKEAKILLDGQGKLPNEPHPDVNLRDENLAGLLRLIGVSEHDVQTMSVCRQETPHLNETASLTTSDNGPVRISSQVVEKENDTDNAWTEYETWAVILRNKKVVNSLIGYKWESISNSYLPNMDMINRALEIFKMP